MKKSETLTIRLTPELKEMIEYNARMERRKPAELVALWVEDVAQVETLKKTDLGTEWRKPTYTRESELLLKN